ncbi:MAG: PEP-CTERM sorting domain-containing protein [Deltaproteobacteria bacterium]|nr:PEP-CTERM sorting domain-containing protein [Deltaproteobacteria bacterium]
MKKFLMFLCAITLVFGMVGSASAIPILNDGSEIAIQLDGNGESYGTYINSGDFLFIESGNNEGNNLEAVELLVEGALGYGADEFDLTVTTSVSYSTDDGGNTGTWEANSSPDAVISFYVVKAANAYAMYFVNPAEGTGSWSTFDLWADGYGGADLEISHYTGYNSTTAPVPEPSTILLMGSGLLGLVGYNRKRFSKKS